MEPSSIPDNPTQPSYPGPYHPGPMGPPPDNYLVWAILSTVLCCLPLGIVSIIKSSQVNSKWQMGDYAGARKDAEDAKKFAIWSAVSIAIVYALIFIFYIIMIVFGLSIGAMSGWQ